MLLKRSGKKKKNAKKILGVAPLAFMVSYIKTT